jgi:hypothetical protein
VRQLVVVHWAAVLLQHVVTQSVVVHWAAVMLQHVVTQSVLTLEIWRSDCY